MEILTTINGISIKRNFVESLPYNPNLKQLSKDKRKAGIYSEVLFWQQVRNKQFHRIDFDRQRIIGNYIVDFYVKALGLVVEIDGISDEGKIEYDESRQLFLESLGLKVFRVTDGAVLQRTIDVLEAFVTLLNEKGIPTPLVHTILCPPSSRMDVLNETEIDTLIAKSKLVDKYDEVVDTESAYEILTAKLEEAAKKTEAEKVEAKKEKEESSFFDNPVVKQIGRTAANVITRSLLGALGLGGRSSKRKSLF